MSTGDFFSNPTSVTVISLEERNRLAQETINEYVQKHAAIDIGLGVVSLLPGAAIPALMIAIAAQAPVIYQPLAKKLAQIYLASPEDLASVRENEIETLVVINAGIDMVAEFGVEFIKQIVWEIMLEAGLGALAATFIPLGGAVIAAFLDYHIANKMTNRVGRMVALYFQNGGQWQGGSKKATYEAVKEIPHLDDIRKVSGVRETLLNNVRQMVRMMRQGGLSQEQVRQALCSSNVPQDLIDQALRTA